MQVGEYTINARKVNFIKRINATNIEIYFTCNIITMEFKDTATTDKYIAKLQKGMK